MNRCLLGLDYGDSRTGVALAFGDGPALPLCVIDSTVGRRKTAAEVADVAAAKSASFIVVGLPVNMDGTKGRRVAATEKFARALREELAARNIPAEVVFWDERLTSRVAESELREMNYSGGRDGTSDQIAAAIILEDYIQYLNNTDDRDRAEKSGKDDYMDDTINEKTENTENEVADVLNETENAAGQLEKLVNDITALTSGSDVEETPDDADENSDSPDSEDDGFEGVNLISLYDEEGNEYFFDLLDYVDYNEKLYAILIPDATENDSDSDEVVVMETYFDGNEPNFVFVDDEELAQKILDEYTAGQSEG